MPLCPPPSALPPPAWYLQALPTWVPLARPLTCGGRARTTRCNRGPAPLSGRTIVSVGRGEADVGEAREVQDRLTDAAVKGDSEALKALYAEDAVAETPDQGTITGRDQIAAYLGEFSAAFPSPSWRTGTSTRPATRRSSRVLRWDNTGSMTGPNGETIPATGRRVRARECDIVTVENGVVTRPPALL